MKRISTILLAAFLAACGGTTSKGDNTGDDDGSNGSGDEWDQQLATRVVDYNAALRIAALRLTGDLPSVSEINEIASLTDPAAQKPVYEARITEYMSRPTFGRQMFYFWRDTFKMGNDPGLDTAPALAADISVNNRSYMDLFTSPANNCPTFDETTGVATAAECTGTGPKAGVLGNPNVMKQFYSNLGFRRVKFIQETFDCAKFPAELNGAPTEVGAQSPYVGTWPFTSIAGTDNGGRINFHDVSAVICANCHTTINHIAPLFAPYDDQGAYQPQIAVLLPIDGSPTAMLSDYLPAGEVTSWRYQVPAADIPALGADMAADPLIAKCGVARIWNWALGHKDIVDSLEEVPDETIQGQVDAFTANGFKLKDLILAVFTADDFVKF